MAKNKRTDLNDAKTVLRYLSGIAAIGFIILAAGLGLRSGVSGLTTATAALWAAASAAAGALTGFLFGIPRVLQSDHPIAPEDGDSEEDPPNAQTGHRRARYQVNTNLEQISDWLTKIIVGIGLVELRNVPEAIEDLANYFARSAPDTGLETIGAAIVVFFGVLGFLLGYLATRLYLAGAFSRADRLMNYGDFEMTGEQVSDQKNALLTDMLKSLSRIVRTSPETASKRSDGGAQPAADAIHNVLWVDDKPSNNGLLIKNLRDQGLRVTLVENTLTALDLLEKGSYDRIITDMGREEGGEFKQKAGIHLITQLKGMDEYRHIPMFVYTSRRVESQLGEEAKAAGADAVTSSPVELLSLLGVG